jgi:type I restriction enzyme R subunit
VVDFADIEAEFEKTNKAYFAELQSELGDEMKHYSDLGGFSLLANKS